MAKNKIFRFAFGTADNPSSSVWRIVVQKNKGDIYINNSAPAASTLHLALHASGQFHFKHGSGNYKNLKSPISIHPNAFLGPVIFYDLQERERQSPKATGSTKLINWLGEPNLNHLFLIKTIYCNKDFNIEILNAGTVLYSDSNVKLYNHPMDFHLVLEQREMSAQEIESNKNSQPEIIDFKGSLSEDAQIELIRVTNPNSMFSPSCIVYHKYHIK